MATWEFTDIFTLSPWACGPRALGVCISKILCSHGITIICDWICEKGSDSFQLQLVSTHSVFNLLMYNGAQSYA